MAIDEAPACMIRLTVAIECPNCRAIPDRSKLPGDLAQPGGLLKCRTCGKAEPKQQWLRMIPQPDVVFE